MGKRKATRSEIIERNEKIVKDYEDGLSFEQLSEKYGLCVRTCYRALDEEQQAQRIAEEQDHTNLVDKIVAEYQKNTAVRDIAEKYGVSISYCSAIAVRAGISNKELSHRRITRRQQKRNDEIFEKYQNGIDAKDLAKAYHYSFFSGMVNSALGKTQKNIGMVFDYARKSPCVLCLDEIDAIGTRRGGKDDVAEMNRVTIALMQELDRLGNDTILIGTTNRPDTLDDALLRRFTFGHTVRPLCRDDARTLARLFFASVGYSASETEIESLLDDTSQYFTASKITNLCIDHIIDWVASQEVTSCIGKV